jgi:hypothetical protein
VTGEIWLSLKSQFITDAQNIFHLNQCTDWRVWSMAVAPLQRSPGGWEWSDRHEKCFGKTCLNFQWNLNTLDENLKDWGRVNVGAVTRKLFADIYWCKTFLFVCGTHSWSLTEHSRYILRAQQPMLHMLVTHIGQTVRPEQIKWAEEDKIEFRDTHVWR